MQNSARSNTIATGLAMFSMFFGAGNVVFPLAIGQYAQDKNVFAIIGLLITAVGVPFLGLISMTLFDGDYRRFFGRIGKVPGFLAAFVIMGLIGPFGALPRCIALSYSTVSSFIPGVSLSLFSILSCLVIFVFAVKRNRIVDILGYVLTPLLLISLVVIIVMGLIFSPEAIEAPHNSFIVFLEGLRQGYQTMDLPGALFFSSVILVCLKKDLAPEERTNYTRIVTLTLKASCIGATLLALTYIGFSYVAAFNSHHLSGVTSDALIGQIATMVLGDHAGILASVVVALACLTTAIALASVFAEFVYEDISQFKIGYGVSLAITLVIAYFVSTLSFTVIASWLMPILEILYPALIALSLVNIAYMLWNFKPVKIPVLIVFAASIFGYFYGK